MFAGIVYKIEGIKEYDMDAEMMRELINELFKTKQYDRIKELLMSNGKAFKVNDLTIAYYLIPVCEQEKEEGRQQLFEKVESLEELIKRYKKLVFYLRRIDFDVIDDGMDEFYLFLEQNKVSLQELFIVLYCGVVHKEKVQRIIQEKIKEGKIRL